MNKMGIGGIIGLIGGLMFGILLLALAFFCCRQEPRRKIVEAAQRNGVIYQPISKKEPLPLNTNGSVLRRGPTGNSTFPAPFTMTTFGMAGSTNNRPLSIDDSVKLYLGDQVDTSGVGEVVAITPRKAEVDYLEVQARSKPDITLSTASLATTDDTDDLSTLGVPISRPRNPGFPDPLGSWDDLEPDLKNRRSLNLENLDVNRTDITLTGPTQYPVMLSNPSPASPSSPLGSLQKVHYHFPEGRERSTERSKSLERGRTRTPTRL